MSTIDMSHREDEKYIAKISKFRQILPQVCDYNDLYNKHVLDR